MRLGFDIEPWLRTEKLLTVSGLRLPFCRLAQLMDSGVLVPVVDSTFALSDVRAAFARLMSGRAVGKVVVEVGTSNEK